MTELTRSSTQAATQASGSVRRRVPGEPELWILLLGDLAVFTVFFGVLGWQHRSHPTSYAAGQAGLSSGLGLANTVLPLTGSALVASALNAARARRWTQARNGYLAAALCGLGFVAIKAVEYSHQAGRGTVGGDDFLTYYFVFTGIHLAHVVVGLACLGVAARRCASGAKWPPSVGLLEGLGAYWHLVDLVWIVLFALLYLA